MIEIRKAQDRGHANHGWLDTYQTFSFGSYRDPRHMGFRSLRVMNEDFVKPGQGFGTHPHHDMEIVTYILEGALEHKDSMGNGEVLRPGEFQRMSAGTGITHSEFNPSDAEPVHLYQIWLVPERKGVEPSYEQKRFPEEERHNRLRLVASQDAADGSLLIHRGCPDFLVEPRRREASGARIEAGPTRMAASAAGCCLTQWTRSQDERWCRSQRRTPSGNLGKSSRRSHAVRVELSLVPEICRFRSRKEFDLLRLRLASPGF